jgi:hypothetical protein
MGRILLLARFVIFVREANVFRRIFDPMISVNYLWVELCRRFSQNRAFVVGIWSDSLYAFD